MRKALPTTLDGAFAKILERIEAQDPSSATTAVRTLAWIYYGRRPLTVPELAEAERRSSCKGEVPSNLQDVTLFLVRLQREKGELLNLNIVVDVSSMILPKLTSIQAECVRFGI